MSLPAASKDRRAVEATLQMRLRPLRLNKQLIEELAELCVVEWDTRERRTVPERERQIAAVLDAARVLKGRIAELDFMDHIGIFWAMGAKPHKEPWHTRFLPELMSACELSLEAIASLPRKARRAPTHGAHSLVAFIADSARKHGVAVGYCDSYLSIVAACLDAAGIRASNGAELDPVPLVKRELARQRRRRAIAQNDLHR